MTFGWKYNQLIENRNKIKNTFVLDFEVFGDKEDKTIMEFDVLFQILIAVSKQRDVSVEEFSDTWNVSFTFLNNDEIMQKTAKAYLAKMLESKYDEIQGSGWALLKYHSILEKCTKEKFQLGDSVMVFLKTKQKVYFTEVTESYLIRLLSKIKCFDTFRS